jgi:hypothetical protein
MQHTILTVRVLNRYVNEFLDVFPCGNEDKLIGKRKSADGCTELRFEISAEDLRSEQRQSIETFTETMLDRLELLRNSPAMRGRTLFQWNTYVVRPPRHDLSLLTRQPWREVILAQSL